MAEEVLGPFRMCSDDAVVTPAKFTDGFGDGGGATGITVRTRRGAGNRTVKGTSPAMPDASIRESGTVAICSIWAPQFPGQRSIVSRTVKVIDGTAVRVPSGFLMMRARPAALR